MGEPVLILCEHHPTPPRPELLRQAVTAWLVKQLSK